MKRKTIKIFLILCVVVVSIRAYYFVKQKAINDELEALNREHQLEWFGSFGYYEIENVEYDTSKGSYQVDDRSSSTGIYNPKILHLIRIWEEEGLASLPVWEISNSKNVTLQEAFDIRKEELEENGVDDFTTLEEAREQLSPSQQELVFGGAELTEIEYYENFLSDIRDIGRWYRTNIRRDVFIKEEWQELIRESHQDDWSDYE